MVLDILAGLTGILVGVAYVCWELGLKWIFQAIVFGILILPPVGFLLWTWNRFLKLSIAWKTIFVLAFFLFNTLYEVNGKYHPLLGIGKDWNEQLLLLPETFGPGIDRNGNFYPETSVPFADWFNDSLIVYLKPVYRFANRVALAGLFVPSMWMGIMGYYIILLLIPLLLFGSYRQNIFNRWSGRS